MTRRFLYLTVAAAAFAALLAGAASARFAPGVGGAGDSRARTPLRSREDRLDHGSRRRRPQRRPRPRTEAGDANEANGTATSDGTTITVTRTDGSTLTCTVPAGFDVTPFLTGNVKAECENGALREIRSGTGEAAEPGDDNSGPGNADDEQGDDNSGPGNADETTRATTTRTK